MRNRSPMLALALAPATLLLLFVACDEPGDGPEAATDTASADSAAGDLGDSDAPTAEPDTDTDSDAPSDDLVEDEADVVVPDPDFLPPAEPGRHRVVLGETRRVIPGDGLPPETVPQTSNNNLDVVRHIDGRVYLAWRTAPSHFAAAETAIHVVSSSDERTWRFEATLRSATDLREPRFLSLAPSAARPDGALLLYLARLGDDPLGFTPQDMLVSERAADGSWSEPVPFYEPGYIPWRVHLAPDGTPLMTAYVGGESIYQFDRLPYLEIDLLASEDGRTWTPLPPGGRAVSVGGGSETAFAFSDLDGALHAVVRNEAGDETGWGSKICRAPPADPTAWDCHHDPRKYDSPLMFAHDGEVYLIGRRNLSADGHYDLGKRNLEHLEQSIAYQLDYRARRKRCSLWRVARGATAAGDRVVFLADLPSRGDTCFASVLAGEAPGHFVIYNYSSPLDGPDPSWAEGQEGPTHIYRTELQLVP